MNIFIYRTVQRANHYFIALIVFFFFSCKNEKLDDVDLSPDFTSKLEGVYIDSLPQASGRFDFQWTITKTSNSSVQITFIDKNQTYPHEPAIEFDTARNVKVGGNDKWEFKFLSDNHQLPCRVEIAGFIEGKKLKMWRKKVFSDGSSYENKMVLTKVD